MNTKNANTFTGKQGKESIDVIAKNLSRILTIKESKSQAGTNETVKIKDLIFASTGVIGEEFPVDKIKDSIPNLVDKLKKEHNKMYWLKMASTIMTTDTRPKVAYEEIIIGDELIKIGGIAKGSGMIAPNLATMLSFIFTNADINSNLLKKYGTDWKIEYPEVIHKRLKSWGMNTLGNWTKREFYKQQKTAYTVAVHFSRPEIKEGAQLKSLPDAFDALRQ